MAYDVAAVVALGINIAMYVIIFSLQDHLRVDLELINKLSKKNQLKLKTDAIVKFVILILVLVMNLTVVGFSWYFANQVDSQLALMAFVHFIINIVAIIALTFLVWFKLFTFPFHAVRDFFDKATRGAKK